VARLHGAFIFRKAEFGGTHIDSTWIDVSCEYAAVVCIDFGDIRPAAVGSDGFTQPASMRPSRDGRLLL
jgi:hypothetical protein